MQLKLPFTMSPFSSSSMIAIVQEFNAYDWYGPNLPPTWGQHPDFEKRMNQVFEKHINLLLCQPTCIESYSGTPTKCSCISRCSKADLLRNLQSYAWTHQSERLQFLSHYISLGFFSSQADIDDGMHCIQTEALPSNYFNPEYKGPKIPNSREVCTNTYRNLFAITRSEWSFIKLIASKNHRLWAWALENLLPPRGLHRLPISDKNSACKKYINWVQLTSKESIVSKSSLRQKYRAYCREMGVPIIQEASGAYHPSSSDDDESYPIVAWSTFRRYWNKHHINSCVV